MNDNRQELLIDLIEKLTKVTHAMHSGNNFPFGKYMLGRQQLMILFFVFEKKGLASVKELAKSLKVTSGAVTQLVDALVKKKLVQREKSPDDLRVVNVKLTETTKKQFNEFKSAYLTNAGRFFQGLSDSEIKQFIKLLGKIKKNSD